MKPTFAQHNDFLAHKRIDCAVFEHNDYVHVVAGEHRGKKGSIVSIEDLGENPIYLVELESGSDVHVPQSHIERHDS
jgi:ribosomal protein L24